MTDNKRRILVVQFSSALDGSTFSALLLMDGLRKRGWKTTVIFANEGPAINMFMENGHETAIIPHKSWLRTKKMVHFIKYLVQEYRNARNLFSFIKESSSIDLVYVNTSASLAGILAARKAGIPSLWHLRELFENVGGEIKAPNLLMSMVRYLFNTLPSQKVINSQAVGKNVLGTRYEDAHLVANACNDSFFNEGRSVFSTRTQWNIPLDVPVIGVPGTLRPMKGHPFFLRAFKLLIRSNPDVRAIISGSGSAPYTALIQNMVEELELGNHILFLGTIRDMPAFYRASDIVCIPSVAEPFGRIAIEAFAVGTPVVASRVGGLKEIIEDRKTGILVPYDDAEELSTSMLELLNNSDFREELTLNASSQARQKYRAEIYQSNIATIIQHTLNPELINY